MRKYGIGIIFLLLFEVQSVQAQKSSELNEFNRLFELAQNNLLENRDSAIFYIAKAEDLVQNFESSYYKGILTSLKADLFMYATDLVNALISSREAVNVLSAYPDSTTYIEAELSLGNVFLEMDDYLRALIQFRKVIDIGDIKLTSYSAESLNEINYIRAKTYAKIAFIYDELGDYQTELDNLMRSTKISYKIDSEEAEKLRITNLINLGFVHYRLGHYQLAEQFVIRNLEEKKKYGQSYTDGQNYQILGLIAEGRGKYALAFAYFKYSDKKLRKYNIRRELIRNEFYRAKVFSSMREYEKAKLKLLSIEQEFVNAFSDHELNQFYSLLTEIYFNLDEQELAYNASRKAQEYQRRRVFTYNSEVIDEFVGYMENKSEAHSSEIIALEAEQELERIRLIQEKNDMVSGWIKSFFIVLVLCLIVIAVLFYMVYRRNKRRQVELQEMIEENKLLFKEVHHRVKNNFQIITSMFNLQEKGSGDEFSVLQEAKKRIQSMALVHNLLYKDDNSAGTTIQFKKYARELAMLILESTLPGTKSIKVEFSGIDMNMDLEMAVPIGLILNELITNSVDHAFPNREKGKILISLRRLKDDSYNLSVSDDGIGFEYALDESSEVGEMGMFLVQILTSQLEGEIKIIRNEGSIVSIDFRNDGHIVQA